MMAEVTRVTDVTGYLAYRSTRAREWEIHGTRHIGNTVTAETSTLVAVAGNDVWLK